MQIPITRSENVSMASEQVVHTTSPVLSTGVPVSLPIVSYGTLVVHPLTAPIITPLLSQFHYAPPKYNTTPFSFAQFQTQIIPLTTIPLAIGANNNNFSGNQCIRQPHIPRYHTNSHCPCSHAQT